MTFTLKLTKLKATLNFPQYNLPYWLGNKFRGGFGSVLLKAVCGYLKPECKSCHSREDCLYYALYVRDRQKRGKSQPVRPITFIPPFFGKSVSGSGKFELEINVFGDYIRYLPHIIYGLRFLGKVGLNSKTKYVIEIITDYFSGKEVYDGESINANSIKTIDLAKIPTKEFDFVKINFLTPIEAKIPISLNYLIHMVRRRLILYVNEYGEGFVPDYTCQDEIVESKWKNHRLTHRSKRGGMREFYGCTGSATYKVEADENAFKLLSIGELIGAGAKASFGMGFFRLQTVV
jgi:CRISPR-associated endoribonuclease Cas6